jgi:hypothetical protein
MVQNSRVSFLDFKSDLWDGSFGGKYPLALKLLEMGEGGVEYNMFNFGLVFVFHKKI